MSDVLGIEEKSIENIQEIEKAALELWDCVNQYLNILAEMRFGGVLDIGDFVSHEKNALAEIQSGVVVFDGIYGRGQKFSLMVKKMYDYIDWLRNADSCEGTWLESGTKRGEILYLIGSIISGICSEYFTVESIRCASNN